MPLLQHQHRLKLLINKLLHRLNKVSQLRHSQDNLQQLHKLLLNQQNHKLHKHQHKQDQHHQHNNHLKKDNHNNQQNLQSQHHNKKKCKDNLTLHHSK